jgi:TolB protein
MKMFFALTSLLLSLSGFAQDAVVAVGTAGQDKDKLVVDDAETKSLTGGQKNISSELNDILRNDFAFYRHKFETIDYADKGKGSFSTPDFNKWKASGITYMIASEHKSALGDSIETKYKAYSVLTGKEIFSGKFSVNKHDLRQNAHRIADAIYRSITGKPSIFNSKIVFVSDRTSHRKDIQKEIYLMDFDGRRVEKLTDFHSVVISPAVAPDNSKIMFSLIASKREVSRHKVRTIKNIDLKVYDLATKKFSTVSDRPGINSGAIYTGRGNQVYLTLSFGGNADIYEMDLGSNHMRKVTTHYADDVDPSVTQDGSLMTFLSNRSGRAHIYTMDPTQAEKDVKRISFVGQFNATPRFSPDGKEIVFSSWVDNSFDLYRISSEGNNLSRLTKNFGSNEEPVYSPDGEFIVFTSKKQAAKGRATQDIYIMNREGEILGQLTQDFGQCASPVWTNLPK